MPADVNVALLRGGNSMGSRGIKEAIKNETVHVVSEKKRERWWSEAAVVRASRVACGAIFF